MVHFEAAKYDCCLDVGFARTQDEGYRDPNTGEIRRVPFEIMVEGDKKPIYEETLEDVRRFNENPALPFNAFGTLALARAEFDANSGSSQVFFLLKVRLLLVLCICLTNFCAFCSCCCSCHPTLLLLLTVLLVALN